MNVAKRLCWIVFLFSKEKTDAEAKLAKLRREGISGVKSRRPDVLSFAGDVRMPYKEMKGELYISG